MMAAMKEGLLAARPIVLVLLLTAFHPPWLSGQALAGMADVPFVGCASDGQTGPVAAPKRHAVKVPINPALAARLAYYRAENGPGVLAPRGWHCFLTYGSNGSSLYVSPDTLNGKQFFSSKWKGFSGYAIQVSESVGDTSGRFQVARAIARAFPDRKQFVEDVISEGIEPARDFPQGPYSTDKLNRPGKDVVEFETPSNTKGLGTDSMLLPNSDPIVGVLILFGEEPNLLQASVRLAGSDHELIHFITGQLEREASQH
jgi:hypothetical protein